MNQILLSTTALCLAATVAQAGGVGRSGQRMSVLYEPGNLVQLSFGFVSPDVSGEQTGPAAIVGGTIGSSSGDSVPDYSLYSVSYKYSFGNGFEAALIVDEPWGAKIDYPDGTDYFATGASAELNSKAVTGVLKYSWPSNFSVFGGIRHQKFDAESDITYIFGYEAEGDRDESWGWLAGIGYEIPAIALRATLTYQSAIDHELTVTESANLPLGPGGSLVPVANLSSTGVTTPQSVNFELQSGIAADTLLFGRVRWVDWSEFEIAPPLYQQITQRALVAFEDDTWTYTVGVGRQLTEQFAGAVSLTWEPQTGGFASNLSPTDGRFDVTVGGTYDFDPVSITGGVSYIWIGEAETDGGLGKVSEWNDNTAIAAGIEIAYRF